MDFKEKLNRFKSTDLYFVTCEDLSNGRTNLEVVKSALKGGVRIIQYREKNIDIKEKLKEVKDLRLLTRRYDSLLIINDHIDIALEVEADGVHLGQKDLSLIEAKKKAPNLLIGISCHNQKQAKLAEKQQASYVNLGPIFATQTKKTSTPVGIDLIKWGRSYLKIPFTVMGGINNLNLHEVVMAGAYHVAVVTAISQKKDIELESKKLIRLIEEYKKV